MSIQGWLAAISGKKRVDLPAEAVHTIIDRNSAQWWFKYGFDHRDDYWNCWATSFWLAKRLPRTAAILETGCGCGFNLIWFGQNGFSKLYGFDNDPTALNAARDLCQLAKVNVTLWKDDGLRPGKLPLPEFSCILALNWTYLPADFNLESFFATYAPYLSRGGVLALDVVDVSYNKEEDSRYCTQDCALPRDQRRPSEYITRWSKEEIQEAANANRLRHIHTIAHPQQVPKIVYVLDRPDV